MKVNVRKPFSVSSDRTHRRRDVLNVKYHRGGASFWGRIETFACNRKDSHLASLEKLEAKLEKDVERRKRDLEQTQKAHEEARERVSRARTTTGAEKSTKSQDGDGSRRRGPGRPRKPATATA